jgi:putative ABC transport system ATP-binding protein
MNMIELRGVSKEYRGKKSVFALRDINLNIAAGEMVSIMGPSGSGKSTLLNLIGGLDSPTSGSITLDGADLTRLTDAQLTRLRRECIGFVFQFFNLIPTLTAAENTALPLYLARVSRQEAKLRASEMLRAVGLSEREDHLPDELSGGEQQRVAIARALVLHPKVILADEPTGNLDSKSGEEILNLIQELHQRMSATILLVTHDSRAAAHCARCVTMRDGQIENLACS